jgi:hypothetical protein
MRLNFEIVPLADNSTALMFSASGRKKKPDGICLAPTVWISIFSGDDQLAYLIMPEIVRPAA